MVLGEDWQIEDSDRHGNIRKMIGFTLGMSRMLRWKGLEYKPKEGEQGRFPGKGHI